MQIYWFIWPPPPSPLCHTEKGAFTYNSIHSVTKTPHPPCLNDPPSKKTIYLLLPKSSKSKCSCSKFVLVVVSRSLDDVRVEVLWGERLNLFVEVSCRWFAHRLLLTQEDGGVTVDPVLQRLLTVVTLVNNRLEFAGRKGIKVKLWPLGPQIELSWFKFRFQCCPNLVRYEISWQNCIIEFD